MSAESELSGPPGTRFSSIRHVGETGSTNADLLERASGGAPEGLVLVTDHQTAGRGRQARTWHDEPGNSMLMSVLLRPQASFAALTPLLAGVAVTDGIHDLLASEQGSGPAPLALKWPNDVLVPHLGERKLAGILAEASTDGAGLAVVVGMGCNLRWATPPPAEIAERAATVEEVAGRSVDRWAVVGSVLTALERWLDRAETEGPDVLLGEYRRRCLTIGRAVRFQTPTIVVEGRAVAVADSGGLVVDSPTGLITLTAGDAHHV